MITTSYRLQSGPGILFRILALGVLASSVICGSLGAQAGGEEAFAGHWEGAIQLPTGELQVAVDLSLDAGEWSGTIDIPAQGAKGLGLEGITIDGAKARFTITGVPGGATFDGELAEGKIAGKFEQGPASLDFELSRDQVIEAPNRPQEPIPPFPYEVEEVSYTNEDVVLGGSLTLPPGEGPFVAALMITGSGAQNRDEELLGHKPFLVIADHLTRQGIAVLRVDDRGVGASTGSVSESTTADFAEDVLAGVRFLARHDKIDPARIGLIGHSEGGLVAPLAVSRANDGEVAFAILLAGTGVPGSEILIKQLDLILRAGGATDAMVERRLEQQHQVIDMLSSDRPLAELEEEFREIVTAQVSEAPPGQRVEGEALETLIEQQRAATLSPWFRYFVTHDPRPALRQVTVPVLALNGELDLQVDARQNLPEIGRALIDAGNLDVTLRTLPGLNHLFQTTETGSPSEYAEIEETFSPAVLNIISGWILDRFSGG